MRYPPRAERACTNGSGKARAPPAGARDECYVGWPGRSCSRLWDVVAFDVEVQLEFCEPAQHTRWNAIADVTLQKLNDYGRLSAVGSYLVKEGFVGLQPIDQTCDLVGKAREVHFCRDLVSDAMPPACIWVVAWKRSTLGGSLGLANAVSKLRINSEYRADLRRRQSRMHDEELDIEPSL